jgi:hypothetical protein
MLAIKSITHRVFHNVRRYHNYTGIPVKLFWKYVKDGIIDLDNRLKHKITSHVYRPETIFLSLKPSSFLMQLSFDIEQ